MKKSTIVFLALLLFTITSITVKAQRITVTLAGNGSFGFGGDGGGGLFSVLNQPFDICLDAQNNIYFSDSANGRIRKLSAINGIITTIAGGGTSPAEGIPATSAFLNGGNICSDASGNIYVVSSWNNIRKIDAITNTITTIAGTGSPGFSGDGGPAILASFSNIQGICTDISGNIYLVDQGNNRIRKIDGSTGIVSTIAGTGVSLYFGDGGLATDADLQMTTSICVNNIGDVIIADQDFSLDTRLRKISASTGIITRIAGGTAWGSLYGVPALTVEMGNVTGLCIDRTGNLYFNEISCSCRKMDIITDTIYQVAGDFAIEAFTDNRNSNIAYMSNPMGLCIDGSQNIYVADRYNNRIRKIIQLTHTPTFAFGKGESFYSCPGAPASIDTQLTITDLDSGQTETWTVISAPLHGALSGFPATASSYGTDSITRPTGAIYTSAMAYSGIDSFKIKVSDGVLSDTVTIYVTTGAGEIAGPSRICAGAPIYFSTNVSGGTWSLSNSNATVSTVGVVTGLLAGTDSINYTVNNSCGIFTSKKEISIELLPPSTAGIITGPASVCIGSMITLADTIAGGAWNVTNTNSTITTSGAVTGILPGMDSILYSVSNACGTTTTTTIVSIVPLPVAGAISNDSSLCIGSTIMLTDTATGGIWSASNSLSTVSAGLVTGLSAGTDTIFYSVSNSCGISKAIRPIEIINCALGISPAPLSPQISFYPNPVSSFLNMEWSGLPPGNCSIRVTDITGQVVMKNDFLAKEEGTKTLYFAELKEGVYLLNVSSMTFHYDGKVLVSR